MNDSIQPIQNLVRVRPSLGKALRGILIALSLLFAVWIAFDFVTHPLQRGANQLLSFPLFRWLSFITGIFSLCVAFVIVRRVRGNPIGPLLVLWGIGALGWSIRTEWGSPLEATWASLVFNLYFYCICSPAIVLLFYFFPGGKTWPVRLEKWIIWLAVCTGFSGLLSMIGSPPGSLSGMPNPLYRPGFEFGGTLYSTLLIISAAGALISLVLRYTGGSALEKLQLRWFMWLLAVLIVFTLLSPLVFDRLLSSYSLATLMHIMFFIFWQGFPAVAIGIAMLRYRLWDIDLIIRKTLVYGTLTAFLGFVYYGLVLVIQSGFRSIIGTDSPVAIVISTLSVAALFNPLRQRIQMVIDRRFYRGRYDSDQAVQGFAAALREEVDIHQLSDQLVQVVDQTIQPESVSLWIRSTGETKR